MGHQHHHPRLQWLVPHHRLDGHLCRFDRPRYVRWNVASRVAPHFLGRCFGGRTKDGKNPDEHQFGHAWLRRVVQGRVGPRVVLALALGGVHDLHELQHDASVPFTKHEATQRHHARTRIYLGHRFASCRLGQPQTPAEFSLR